MTRILLDQTCPHCGTTEAAGAYCTKCLATTQGSWIHQPKVSGAALAAREAKRRRGSAEAAK